LAEDMSCSPGPSLNYTASPLRSGLAVQR
jgi:hypothetical protein